MNKKLSVTLSISLVYCNHQISVISLFYFSLFPSLSFFLSLYHHSHHTITCQVCSSFCWFHTFIRRPSLLVFTHIATLDTFFTFSPHFNFLCSFFPLTLCLCVYLHVCTMCFQNSVLLRTMDLLADGFTTLRYSSIFKGM